ncbi:M24 family metallopeptidase [Brevibacterium sp.]|uniref:M24 family metallopeptidase n=1 Tax=Brevibacterium sp. TaxID=1701 RepID=UPI0028125F51|nr:M24 family metallopeptidase [Brevibacterium sp.]
MTSGTPAEVAAKHSRIAAILSDRGLDALVLTSAGSLSWLLAGARVTVSAAGDPILMALVTRDRIHLGIYSNEVERILAEEVPASVTDDDFIAVRPVPWFEPLNSFVDSVAGSKTWTIGAEVEHASELRSARAVLLAGELDRYRALCRDAAAAMTDVLGNAEPGMRECDLSAALAGNLRSKGAEPLVLLASGESRAHHRHPLPTEALLGRRAMLVTSARRHGLIANVTRWVRFGEPADGELELESKLLDVESDIFSDLEDGRPLSAVLPLIREAYPRRGFHAQEWTRHHQGGAAGYVGRDPRLTEQVPDTIRNGQAFAWNPSAYSAALGLGVKVEDTVVFDGDREDAIDVLTVDDRWPTVSVHGIARPVPLQL